MKQIMIAGEWRDMSGQNKAMHEALESIAQTWDGCEVDVTSVGAVDVGEALRKQFSPPSQPAQSPVAVPDEVLRAVERMSQPLHESRLKGATAEADAQCMKVIADFIGSLAAALVASSEAISTDAGMVINGVDLIALRNSVASGYITSTATVLSLIDHALKADRDLDQLDAKASVLDERLRTLRRFVDAGINEGWQHVAIKPLSILVGQMGEHPEAVAHQDKEVRPTSADAAQIRNAALEAATDKVLARCYGDAVDDSYLNSLAAEIRALKSSPQVAPVVVIPEPCDNEIHQNGAVVAIMDCGTFAMEGLVKEANKITPGMDWHYFGGRAVVKTLGDVTKSRAALEFAMPRFLDAASPVLTQSSEQPDQSDGDILKHMSRYWEHQWHDGDQYLVRISRENLGEGIRALLASSQPVSGAVDEQDKPDANSSEIIDWIENELTAITCSYHGDPSYDHDAYWMRDKVVRLLDDARKAFVSDAARAAQEKA